MRKQSKPRDGSYIYNKFGKKQDTLQANSYYNLNVIKSIPTEHQYYIGVK